MRDIDEGHISAEDLSESGRLGYEFYRQVVAKLKRYVRTGLVAPHPR